MLSEHSFSRKGPFICLISTKFDPHVDMIVPMLVEAHIPFARFNTEDFPMDAGITMRLGNGGQEILLQVPNNDTIPGGKVTSIWYRRPGAFEFPASYDLQTKMFAEQEVGDFMRGLWDLLPVIWVNHPEANRRANVKLHQLDVAQQLGFTIPSTIVTNNPSEFREFYGKHHGNVIIKPLSRGVYDKEGKPQALYTSVVGAEHMNSAESIKNLPVFIQENIPKAVELRITIVGDNIFPVAIHSQEREETKTDWRVNGLALKHTVFELPLDITARCHALVKTLNLNFGAIDMILTPTGEYVFLEINPNGQWAWIEEMTGLPIASALIGLLSTVST